MRAMKRTGFTLIELLVILILLGLLTAIVFPVVIQQIEDGEPTKTANDLTNIRTGIEVFHLNVRPRWPGDLEDLIHRIDVAEDGDIEENAFTTANVAAWNGPYIDASVLEDASGAVDQVTGDAILTGFSLQIQNQLVCYDPAANTFDPANNATDGCDQGDFVAVLVGGATIQTSAPGTEFNALDELLDDSDTYGFGKIRAAEADGAVLDDTPDAEVIVYLASPFTAN